MGDGTSEGYLFLNTNSHCLLLTLPPGVVGTCSGLPTGSLVGLAFCMCLLLKECFSHDSLISRPQLVHNGLVPSTPTISSPGFLMSHK